MICSVNFSLISPGDSLAAFDVFLAGPRQVALLELRVDVHDLLLDDVRIAQPFAVLVAGQRLRHALVEFAVDRIRV
ncbi:hypothetical protein LJK88_20125 [Paenibacillus sp. P26]|nr:hypothetical protein LJK88_20125 [Paenibacillus sp. P26]